LGGCSEREKFFHRSKRDDNKPGDGWGRWQDGPPGKKPFSKQPSPKKIGDGWSVGVQTQKERKANFLRRHKGSPVGPTPRSTRKRILGKVVFTEGDKHCVVAQRPHNLGQKMITT